MAVNQGICSVWSLVSRGQQSAPRRYFTEIELQKGLVESIAQVGQTPRSLRVPARLRATWWSALLLFLYDSGARIQAALSIKPEDVDFEERTVVLRGEHSKTGKEQLISLSEETCEAIRALLASQGASHRSVFVYPWARRKIWLDFREIMETAGVRAERYVAFHRLRKTHATQQVVAVGWEQARVALGHSSESMTKRYVDIRQIPRTPLAIPRPTMIDPRKKGD